MNNFNLPKIDDLFRSMKQENQYISISNFNYKKKKYFMIFKGIKEQVIFQHKNYKMRLEFYSADSIDQHIGPYLIDKYGFPMNELKVIQNEIRKFFKIDSFNGGPFLPTFLSEINTQMDDKVTNPNENNESERKAISSSCLEEQDDINKIYCYAIKRNKAGHKRTEKNTLKTQALEPELYDLFVSHTSDNSEIFSFCFSSEKSDKKTPDEIITNFEKRESLKNKKA
ncbi:hypothetical protein AKUA1202_05480 [Apilactobacillus kunkeei]|nr:hypothetical protein AKUA1802_05340 [Apilactobacillus kunkeei]CAI2585289.1 hypothetical protein AKUA0901_05340 [Apilactobacillus kunkeei]CAI2585668.1 hypothetical protein AKUA1201_05340 [Apilactobacillus kunkeei]CAI2585699.1 hypothetical protein AKUA1002_05340 [Apilactobacillus kunkeei]CAI2653690.1 hypothetical protein AKUA1803_05340 [Apilactobacillus kunkeei]